MRTSEDIQDARAAATLLQWGLRPQARPAQEPDYRRLIDRYLDEADFRNLTRAVADGLGLSLLDVGDHGLVLAPSMNSAFSLNAADFRSPSGYADDRLLDGLVQIAIATTVFPRARDLEDDPDLARPPVTVSEVSAQLKALCEALSHANRDTPDPEASDEAQGLYEAWRVYQRRLQGASRSRRSTKRVIEHGLDQLRAHGCFTRPTGAAAAGWRPTRRYQILVQDLAATRLYDEVQRVLAPCAGS